MSPPPTTDHHRASWMRQANKSHKTAVRSAREINRIQGGKVRVGSVGGASTGGSSVSSVGRTARANKVAMVRRNKREALLIARRAGGAGANAGGIVVDGAPLNVALVGLSAEADLDSVLSSLTSAAGPIADVVATKSGCVPQTLVYSKDKLRISVIPCARSNLAVLDAVKAADIVVFVLKVGNTGFGAGASGRGSRASHTALDSFLKGSVDERGREFVTLVNAQGRPAVIGIVQGLDMCPPKHVAALKRHASSFFTTEFGEDIKVVPLSGSDPKRAVESSIANTWPLLRALKDVRPKPLAWRSERSYMISTKAEMLPTATEEESDDTLTGTLCVSGYLRGLPMNVHQLVHIPGQGTFKVKKAVVLADPHAIARRATNNKSGGMDVEQTTGSVVRELVPEEGQMQSLVSEAEPDLLAGEQTWPTPQELAGADGGGSGMMDDNDEDDDDNLKARKPVGTSDYQNTWLAALDEDDYDEEEFETADAAGQDKLSKDAARLIGDDDEETDEAALENYEAYKRRKAQEKDDEVFPDEMDTPHDVRASLRFQKYRGLKSMHSSPWHAKESLPRQYSRIFQFDNFDVLKKHVLGSGEKLQQRWLDGQINIKQEKSGRKTGDEEMNADDSETSESTDSALILPGEYVCLHIARVPLTLLEELQAKSLPLFVGSLLEHEQKLSVVHCTIQRLTACDETLASREPIVLHCGMWRRVVCPTLSENNLNSDKHKAERFLQHGRWTVLSAYAPITFGSTVPVLVFKAEDNDLVMDRGPLKPKLRVPSDLNASAMTLVATGTLTTVNPDRITLKKVVLSGHPVRVKKRWAVVRFMFFSPVDVKWFMPVELWTKHGMAGRILDSVGTHGSMKCQFDKPIKNHDTICMSLYKRVYPKPVHEFRSIVEEDNAHGME